MQECLVFKPKDDLRALKSKNQTKGGRPKKWIHSYLLFENEQGCFFFVFFLHFGLRCHGYNKNIDFTPFLGYFQFLKAENWQKSTFHYM